MTDNAISTEPHPGNSEATKQHIRGSSMLLAGRFISLGLNFLTQIVTVRYLSKTDYGAFAYALALASIGSSLALFSTDKSISRFLPIYDENEEDAKQRGALVLTLGTIIGISIGLIFLVYGFRGFIEQRLISSPLSVSLLLIVIMLTPVGALDNWFQSLFAVFASARAIFVRRYILGPGLKLAAVLFVIVVSANVYVLAWGYVIGGAIGIAAYGLMLRQIMEKQRLFRNWNWRNLHLPVREIMGFSAPLMYSDAVFILRNNVILIIIGYFHSSVGVAEFRSVVPVARLNEVVLQSFTFLYTPLAARLFARREVEGINDLYWRTALWIIVFSFPVFVVTFALAEPVTILLFGERYASSSSILAVLSLGYYFNAALGFNNYTLRVYGVIRYILLIDFVAATFTVVSGLILIPRYGAFGAALSAASTLILYNLLNHLGLRLHTDVNLFDWHYLKAYVMVAAGGFGLLILQLVFDPPIIVGLPIAALISLLILRLNRSQLNIAETFPELLKIGPFHKILGA
ncbi:MAG: flippase [Chloroflexi bacterium]|nr:flippase [Chloroflexota bacterium]